MAKPGLTALKHGGSIISFLQRLLESITTITGFTLHQTPHPLHHMDVIHLLVTEGEGGAGCDTETEAALQCKWAEP